MNLLGYFNEVESPGWTTAGEDVQFKVVNRVLYLQCSHGLSDWLHNLDAVRAVYADSEVSFIAHRGFTKLWLSIKDEIEKLDFDTIVGYSEGSAIAVYVHENFYHRKGYEPRTYAFGCPAVIWKPNRALRSRFSNFTIIINPRDIVYYCALLLGYRHVGITKKLPRVRLSKKKTWRERLADLTGHTPERYRLALKEFQCG